MSGPVQYQGYPMVGILTGIICFIPRRGGGHVLSNFHIYGIDITCSKAKGYHCTEFSQVYKSLNR